MSENNNNILNIPSLIHALNTWSMNIPNYSWNTVITLLRVRNIYSAFFTVYPTLMPLPPPRTLKKKLLFCLKILSDSDFICSMYCYNGQMTTTLRVIQCQQHQLFRRKHVTDGWHQSRSLKLTHLFWMQRHDEIITWFISNFIKKWLIFNIVSDIYIKQ